MRRNLDHTTTAKVLIEAKEKGLPVTITYMKEEKDEVTGKKTGRMVETVRTVEIYDETTTKAGNRTFKVMDREAFATDTAEGKDRPGARTFRLDRIVFFTVNRTSLYTVPVPEEIAEKLAAAAAVLPVHADELVERELENDIDAPPVQNLRDLDPATSGEDRLLILIHAVLAA